MPSLLVVHHTPSPAVRLLLEAAIEGARDPGIHGVEVRVEPALSATASDVLAADGYLLITPANIGWMSGALKHFFDGIYYPCLDATARRPWAGLVHGNDDTSGAVRSVERITAALSWRAVAPTLSITGHPSPAHREAAYDLGATIAVTLAEAAASEAG